MSPKIVLFALAIAALVGVGSYITSAMLVRNPATQPVSPTTSTTSAQRDSFHAIVERNGAVVLCVSRGEILFPDRCAGSGHLLIVQPIEEGEAAWVSAAGVVAMENESPQNPECALSRTKWVTRAEVKVSTGRKIRKIPPEIVAQQLNKIYAANLLAEDVSAFGLDLNDDGREDIIYVANNIPRIAKLHDKTGNAYPYFVQGGIFNGRAPDHPSTFFHEIDEYRGGTDAIGQVVLKGIVPIAATSGELAVLAKVGGMLDGNQSLVRLGGSGLQRIDSFEFRCH